MQTNHELHGERLERLEGIVHSQEQALLAQERKLREVEEGRKKIGGELRVQAQRQEDWEPTCRPRACPAAGADGLRASAGKPSTLETLTGLSETSAGEVASQEKVGGALKGSPGVWRSPPQPQGSEPRRGAKSKPGGLSEIIKGMQEGPQTSGTGVKCGPGPTTTLPKPGGRPGGALSWGHRSAGKSAQGITKVASPGPGPTQG